MALFAKKPETRTSLLDKAARARSKGKKHKAIKLYQEALALAPGDHEILARLAPLLAETGDVHAWEAFIAAAQGFYAKGFVDKAVGTYRQAATFLPKQVEVWERLADLNLQRKRPRDALDVLCEGSRHFRRRAERPRAIQLLRQAHDIEPYHFAVTMELTRLLASAGERGEVRALLEGLAERVRGRELRRVRGRLLRQSPTPAAAWRWLRAATVGR